MKNSFITAIKYALCATLGLILGAIFFSGAQHDDPKPIQPTENTVSTIWTCSMHPQIQLPKKGLCPICGMNLIPLLKSSEETSDRIVTLSVSDAKLAEIITHPVERKWVTKSVRLVGKIYFDETRVKSITSWFPFRVDRLFVDYTGVQVKEGDHLAEIYSPDLITATEELFEAHKRVKENRETENEFIKESNFRALESAREKLRLFGLLSEQIKDLEMNPKSTHKMVINAPVGGTVIQKEVREGEYTKVGTRMFTIADLSKLWVILEAYETDLPWLHYGQSVTFQTEAYPGKIFTSTLSFIDPVIDPSSRTVKVRVQVENQENILKPEMLVKALVKSRVSASGQMMAPDLQGKWVCPMHPEVIKEKNGLCEICEMDLVQTHTLGYKALTEHTPPLVIPESSVLQTGKRSIVYVRLKDRKMPAFEGREVLLGPKADGYFIVLNGLGEHEEVVVNGSFKLDASQQIQAKPSMMDIESGEFSTQENISTSHSDTYAFIQEIAPLYDHYFKISQALSSDQKEQALNLMIDISSTLKALNFDSLNDPKLETDFKHHFTEFFAHLDQLTHSGSKTDPVTQLFSELSEIILNIEKDWGHAGSDFFEMVCPMALDGRGGRWLNLDNTVKNPYYGSKMLRCGSIKKTFSPIKGGHSHD